MYLKHFKETGLHAGDSGMPESFPDGFDRAKFDRGRLFYQNNIFSCTLAMLTSLICGLSVENLLTPLVFTGRSDEAKKALKRYLQTFHHVALWHFGDIWNPQSKARESILQVRKMHNDTRTNMMNSGRYEGMQLSQYDMSLVQCGFIGIIIMYPKDFGISYSSEDIDSYIYFWYCVGYLLGIRDDNNICKGKASQVLEICKEIEEDILIPALNKPPQHFRPMAQALIDGITYLINGRPLFSLQAFLAISYDACGVPHPRLSVKDYLRVLFLRSLFTLAMHVPFGRYFLNWMIKRGLNTKAMT